jgi:hypothetical protein
MAKLNCEEFQKSINPLLDGELDERQISDMHEHMDACESCSRQYQELMDVRDMLAHMDDDLVTPAGFESGWRKAVREEKRTRHTRGWVRALSGVAAAFVMLAGATAIRRTDINASDTLPQATAVVYSTNENTDSYDETVALTSDATESSTLEYDTADTSGLEAAMPTEGATSDYTQVLLADSTDDTSTQAKYSYSDSDNLGATSSGGILDVDETSTTTTSGVKMLRSAALTIDSDDFDNDIESIKTLLTKYGGLIERNAISGSEGSRTAELTLRVPAGFLESFVEQLRQVGSVTHSEVSAQDVTSQYTDTALRLDTYRTQLNRVKELTDTASDLNEVLELEAEASRLQYEIDKLTGTLKGLDSQAEMSTVTVTLSEYTHVDARFSVSGFGSQLSEQFSESMNNIGDFLQDMLLTATALLPYLIWIVPLGILLFVGLKLTKKAKHRHAD